MPKARKQNRKKQKRQQLRFGARSFVLAVLLLVLACSYLFPRAGIKADASPGEGCVIINNGTVAYNLDGDSGDNCAVNFALGESLPGPGVTCDACCQ